MRKILIIGAALCFLPYGAAAQVKEISIQQAYDSIPHQRTVYDISQSPLPEREKKFLRHFFTLSDQALQKRIMMLQHFSLRREAEYLQTYNTAMGTIIEGFNLVETPNDKAAKIQETLITALRQQQKFFNDWASVKDTPKYEELHKKYTNEILVISAHQTLLAAYNLLLAAYPNETDHNKKAFFDHLCALDFI